MDAAIHISGECGWSARDGWWDVEASSLVILSPPSLDMT
jgi:uncharacterized membrane protein